MSHISDQQREIYKLAVGMFGAVPGTAYFNELDRALEAGMSIGDLYNTLAESAVFHAEFAFSPVATNAQFADAFLDRLLGSDVSIEGRAFADSLVMSALDGGISRGDAMKAAIDALDRVSDDDAHFGRAAERFDNRIDVARHHTEVLKTSAEDVTFLQSLLLPAAQGDEPRGGVSIDASGQAQSVLFLGASGNDAYISSQHGDTVSAGGGADTITLTNAGGLAAAGQADTLILGSGDSQLNAATDGHDVVSNFGTASGGGALDIIDLGAFGFTGQQASALANKGAVGAAAVNGSTLTQTGFFVSGVARGVAIATNGGDTFVFVDVDKNGDFAASADLFFQLVGVTDVTLANFGL